MTRSAVTRASLSWTWVNRCFVSETTNQVPGTTTAVATMPCSRRRRARAVTTVPVEEATGRRRASTRDGNRNARRAAPRRRRTGRTDTCRNDEWRERCRRPAGSCRTSIYRQSPEGIPAGGSHRTHCHVRARGGMPSRSPGIVARNCLRVEASGNSPEIPATSRGPNRDYLVDAGQSSSPAEVWAQAASLTLPPARSAANRLVARASGSP